MEQDDDLKQSESLAEAGEELAISEKLQNFRVYAHGESKKRASERVNDREDSVQEHLQSHVDAYMISDAVCRSWGDSLKEKRREEDKR